MAEDVDADVLIVGLGPVGATAAALLAVRGLKVLVCDRLPDLYPRPRAIGLDHEVMRVMQELGIAERVRAHVAPYRPSEYRGMSGQLIKRLDAAPPPYPTGWAPNWVFDQPQFEYVLRARLREMSRVRIELETEVVGVGQDASKVWADIRTASGGMRRVSGRYLIACDGGASSIRKGLGIELDDLGFDEPWLVVDVIVSDDAAQRLPQTQVQYCEARPCTFVVGPENHRRWEIMLLPGDPLSSEFPEDALWPLLQRWIRPGEGRLWRAAAYRFHGLIAKQWRLGRILLAGDSAHMTPPFMAQGMVQGIRDAHNLAWKLARVIRDASADTLLDSYRMERQPHVEATTRIAIELGRVICERDPDRARARDDALLAEQNGVVRTIIRQNMIPGLRSGAIDAAAAGAGAIFPQPTVRLRGRDDRAALLDDVTGARVRVVTIAAVEAAEIAEFQHRLNALEGCFVALSGSSGSSGHIAAEEVEGCCLVEWMRSLGAAYAIVRPDHYVYATATNSAEALLQLDALSRQIHAFRT